MKLDRIQSMADDATIGFSLDGYRALLTGLFERGYAVRDFFEFEPRSPHLLLRHDIEMSIAAALEIAAAERDLGVAATYFVLLRSELYSPFSESGRAELLELVAMGHEVGLHFDAALYSDETAALDQAAAWECDLLERLIEWPVRMVSLHRPAQSLLNTQKPLGGRPHTYQRRFFSEIGYCSDSRGDWHHGHPLDHAAIANKRALQLLTHPIWWSGAAADPKERLDRYARGSQIALRRALAQNCDIYEDGAAS